MLPLTTSVDILQQCAAGMHHLHSLGILHRDFRAANMLVAARDPLHIVVADFGVSHQLRVYAQVRKLCRCVTLVMSATVVVPHHDVRCIRLTALVEFHFDNCITVRTTSCALTQDSNAKHSRVSISKAMCSESTLLVADS